MGEWWGRVEGGLIRVGLDMVTRQSAALLALRFCRSRFTSGGSVLVCLRSSKVLRWLLQQLVGDGRDRRAEK